MHAKTVVVVYDHSDFPGHGLETRIDPRGAGTIGSDFEKGEYP